MNKITLGTISLFMVIFLSNCLFLCIWTCSHVLNNAAHLLFCLLQFKEFQNESKIVYLCSFMSMTPSSVIQFLFSLAYKKKLPDISFLIASILPLIISGASLYIFFIFFFKKSLQSVCVCVCVGGGGGGGHEAINRHNY